MAYDKLWFEKLRREYSNVLLTVTSQTLSPAPPTITVPIIINFMVHVLLVFSGMVGSATSRRMLTVTYLLVILLK